jgi:hypothetical protein
MYKATVITYVKVILQARRIDLSYSGTFGGVCNPNRFWMWFWTVPAITTYLLCINPHIILSLILYNFCSWYIGIKITTLITKDIWVATWSRVTQIIILTVTVESRDSSVGTVLGYGLDNQGSRVQFLVGAGNFSLHHHVQNSSGAHPASYPMGTRGSFPGGKAAGVWSLPLTFI